MTWSVRWLTCAAALWCVPLPLRGQTPADTTKPYSLPPLTVSVTRAELPLSKVPLSVQTVDRLQISRAKPTWGLDEALANVPGVFVANRYNFSQDQRISIRGFGARSAFAVRGIKILVDGIPQTLPDGQGQLTNLELGEVDRIEVLRGSSSALFGNASGGVISIWTDPQSVAQVREDARFVAGRFDQRSGRTWNKWQTTTGMRIGNGSALLTVSRLDYEGERDHSAADNRVLNARVRLPLAPGWSLAFVTDVGDNPRADNPGALTRAELLADRDQAPAINLQRNAGKAVTQIQSGATVRRTMANGGEAAFTLFGLGRNLKNPITTAYIDLDRIDYGARASITYPAPLGSLVQRLTAGVDFQRLRDNRKNFAYMASDSAKPDTTRTLDQVEHVMEVGPFVQSALELSPRTSITAGVRYDWVSFSVADHLIIPGNPDDSGDRLMHALSGSLGIATNPSRTVTVYGNVGSSFETPTTTELANSPAGTGGFNTGLKPQQAWNYEIGARGSPGQRVGYTVAVFQADVRDALIPYEIAAPRFYYRNAGSTRHRGLEVSADLSVAPGMNLSIAWTYSDYRYRHYTFTDTIPHVLDGRALPGIPKHWLNLFARAQPAALGGVWAEVQQTYSSGYVVSDTGSTTTSPWWATNVRVGWEGKSGGMRLGPFLGINNAFNHRYVGSVVINAARGRFYEPAPGRNVYLGLTVGAGR
ncbi:MAG TPA: TonB-dependent receptor [Gemmatimonadales bacterium]|jgi:iron complex outermembrane receptor protein|nr:TonB-dependent receptor [Gemmatimonadales bacterium]